MGVTREKPLCFVVNCEQYSSKGYLKTKEPREYTIKIINLES